MNAPPPLELEALMPGKWFKKTTNEWASSCPKCGGTDRFVVWTDKQYPRWRWMCRICNPDGGWLDQLFPKLNEEYQSMNSSEKAKRIAEQLEEQEHRLRAEIDRAQQVLKELQEARAWEKYHRQLDEASRNLWLSWGIPEFYQDYWQLGFDPDRLIFAGGEEYHTPTMTIPIFEPTTWKCINVRHRLLAPPKPNDKYRPERSGLPAAFFVAEPDLKIAGRTLCVEGEKKAMASFITLDDPNMQVVGLPGKTPSDELLRKLSECDPVYICLDPDADGEALASRMEKSRCRVINLPEKIDDMIFRYGLDKSWMRQVLFQSRKL